MSTVPPPASKTMNMSPFDLKIKKEKINEGNFPMYEEHVTLKLP
jgi:hypothetical protein